MYAISNGRRSGRAFVASDKNARVHLKVFGYQVANGMILLLESEFGAIGYVCRGVSIGGDPK
jgi:hypothetical protein